MHHSICHLNSSRPNHPYLWPALLRLITPPSQHYPRTQTLHSSARKISLETRIGYSVTTVSPRSPAFWSLPGSRSFIPSLRHSSLDGRTFTNSSSVCKNSQSMGQCLGAFGARAYSVKSRRFFCKFVLGS